jgi:hypothetical protein
VSALVRVLAVSPLQSWQGRHLLGSRTELCHLGRLRELERAEPVQRSQAQVPAQEKAQEQKTQKVRTLGQQREEAHQALQSWTPQNQCDQRKDRERTVPLEIAQALARRKDLTY